MLTTREQKIDYRWQKRTQSYEMVFVVKAYGIGLSGPGKRLIGMTLILNKKVSSSVMLISLLFRSGHKAAGRHSTPVYQLKCSPIYPV